MVYQIDLGCTRLLWIGKERTAKTFREFFALIGPEVSATIEFVDVLRLMVNGSRIWVLVGLAAAIAGSATFTRLLGGMLYDVRPLDPAVLGGVSMLLAAVALLTSYLPARRAGKIDPIGGLTLRMISFPGKPTRCGVTSRHPDSPANPCCRNGN